MSITRQKRIITPHSQAAYPRPFTTPLLTIPRLPVAHVPQTVGGLTAGLIRGGWEKRRSRALRAQPNVCTGTGKQKTLQDDFDQPAINSKDNRGVAMGLMFATELLSAASP